jgi:hypothetical protein
MVKKIRLIEEEQSSEELDAKEFQAKILEYMQAIDWKLWEMLKIEQARAAREGLLEPEAAADVKRPAREKGKDFKPVVIDDAE